MDTKNLYQQASLKTADDLRSIAQSQMLRDLSSLSLPEIDATVDLVSRMVPAGNVPGVILSGLARLSGRKPPVSVVKRDVNLLFKGVELALDKAIYGAFFAGPAAVIWGYQNLLKLAGKSPEDSFPEGTWQFYVDYALREDTACHATETHGFDTILKQHQISLDPVDRATAWVMAIIHCLHQYPQLLENEWRERVYTFTLRQIIGNQPDAARYTRLYQEWEKQRPYERGSDVGTNETYALYRRRKFDHFLAQITPNLSPSLRDEWTKQIREAEAESLPAFIQQLSIFAFLDPSPYGETRVPLPLKQLYVGVIHQGHYYLIPACSAGAEKPLDVESARALIAALMTHPVNTNPTPLTSLAEIKRATLSSLRQKLSPEVSKELDLLRRAPILLNCDRRPRALPLVELRQTERGVRDHALTLFDTGETFVFDQSHIFFDGAWGAALAEIITNEALAWAVYLHSLPQAQPRQTRPYALALQFKPDDLKSIEQAPRVMVEAGAETDVVKLKAMLSLRRLFKRRNDLIELTINDLLVLYRAIHTFIYRAEPGLLAQLQQLCLTDATRPAAETALAALAPEPFCPAIVIPVDASQRNPRDRLYPMTFEVPLRDLDLLNLHHQAMAALNAYKAGEGDRTTLYTRFDQLQRTYLAMLAQFGAVLSRAKEIASSGESSSVGVIKLLAYMPTPLQRMLDQIPSRFDVLNDLIRGREVISNVGAVAPSSTLTRFMTAKDDNEKKTLAWGVITDASGVMRISLRDFRPHVAMLAAIGRKELATRLTQHYLDTYANGLNDFIRDLGQITETSRETRLTRMEQSDA